MDLLDGERVVPEAEAYRVLRDDGRRVKKQQSPAERSSKLHALHAPLVQRGL